MQGSFPIGNRNVERPEKFHGVDPSTGLELPTAYSVSTISDVEAACDLAWQAFDKYRRTNQEERAAFLESCALELEQCAEDLVLQAMLETGLPKARLEGELGRTCNQLRLFARVAREGHWLDVTIDPALPDRSPLPRPDLRRANIGVGPVAVFGASNFPLAFSVAGGDTASALAAGCPVVVKGHPAHPGTSLIAANAIQSAVKAADFPEGVFSMVQGPGNDLGRALLENPAIKAVGFTGSRAGGLALMNFAAAREEPIPVFAEMSSVNPVILFPGALKAGASSLGEGFAASLAMGAGQFCTNPGLVFALAGEGIEEFIESAAQSLAATPPQSMLTQAICDTYRGGVDGLASNNELVAVVPPAEGAGACDVRPALFKTTASAFKASATMADEIFGPSSIVIECSSMKEIVEILEDMEGQLTSTLHLEKADYEEARSIIKVLERKAGRIVVNGWPTGVEVSHAMVHGGPFPATSDARTTSVGVLAINRFLRPVCYQNMPQELLPDVLRDHDESNIPRYVS